MEYYRLLGVIRTEGNWEAWISFFLEGVTVAAAADFLAPLLTPHGQLLVVKEADAPSCLPRLSYV